MNGTGKDKMEKKDTPLRLNCEVVVRESKKRRHRQLHHDHLPHVTCLRKKKILPASERSWIGQYGCLQRRGGGFYHAVSAICDFNSTIYPFASYWDRVVGRFD
ncbi:hypothetical protein GE21DRAFT_1069922 [Neurospora crassa]|nr:hypothetical protein GE21DRAFT_1069922 [Neurospora crassa]